MTLLHFTVESAKTKSIYPFIILLMLFSVALLADIYGICINMTSSMPEGMYFRDNSKIHRGDIVAFCLEEPYKTIGLKKFYVGKGKACLGTDPLIKQAGDEVKLTDQSITVNGVTYPYQTFYLDSNQRKLAVYPRGTYHAQGYWPIGTHSTRSWDSRYEPHV